MGRNKGQIPLIQPGTQKCAHEQFTFNSYKNESTVLSLFPKEKNPIPQDYEHDWKPTVGMQWLFRMKVKSTQSLSYSS